MRRDEFNNVNITNDKQLRGIEFGKTNSNEIFSQRENTVNKSELNVTQAKDELNEGASDNRQGTHHDDYTQEELRKQFKNNTSNGSESSGSSSTGVESANGASGATSVGASSSGAAASGGATIGAASTAAVSASAVVITAFTVITAAPIIISQATAQLLNFEVGEHEVFYEIELNDVIENGEYRAILSNASYNESKPLEAGMNHGEFFDLEPNTEYNFEVEEGSEVEIKRSLLKRTFTTGEGYVGYSEFIGFSFDKTANFLDGTFTVQLNFIDELDIYSDFAFTLTDANDSSITNSFSLEKTTEPQTIDLNSSPVTFDLENNYSYKLTYKERDMEVVFIEELFTFEDTSGALSEFYGGSVDYIADFVNETFNVNIDFIDDFDILDNIAFVIYDVELGEEYARTYPLNKDQKEFTLDAKESDTTPGLDLVYGSFRYYFIYERKGVTEQTNIQEIEFKGARFYGGTISPKADFKEKTFTVNLDVVDTIGRLDNFVLHISESSSRSVSSFSRNYPLNKDLLEQSFSAEPTDTEDGFDLENGTYFYYFTYYDNGEIVSTEEQSVIFEDIEGRSSTFNSITINKANFSEHTFDVQLDYVDTLNRLDGWHLVLTDNTNDISVSYDLMENEDVQTFSAVNEDSELVLDIEHSSLSYVLTYNESGIEKTVTDSTSFIDKNGNNSIVNAPVFETDGEGGTYFNFYTGELSLTLDYNDYFDYFTDFSIVFSNVGAAPEDDVYTIELEKDINKQILDADMGMEYGIDMTGGEPINYELVYHTIADPDTPITAASGTVTFVDCSLVEVTDIEVGKLQYDGSSYYLPYHLEFRDDRSELEDLEICINNAVIGDKYLVQTLGTYPFHDEKWQYAYFSYGEGLEDLTNNPVTIRVQHYGASSSLFSKEINLVYDEGEGDMLIRDIRIVSDSWVEADGFVNIDFNYVTAENDCLEQTFTIRFVDSYSNQFDIEGVLMPGSYAYPGAISFAADDYSEFISEATSSFTFDVYIIYKDSEDNDVVVQCYSNFVFSIV